MTEPLDAGAWGQQLVQRVGAAVSAEDVRRIRLIRHQHQWCWLVVLTLPFAFGSSNRLIDRIFGEAAAPFDASAVHEFLTFGIVGCTAVLASTPQPVGRRSAPLAPRRLADVTPGWARWLPVAVLGPWIAAPLLLLVGLERNPVLLSGAKMAVFGLLAHLVLGQVLVRMPLRGEDEAAVDLERALRSCMLCFYSGALAAFLPVQLAGMCWLAADEPGISGLDILGGALALSAVAWVALLPYLPIDWQLPADQRTRPVPAT